MEQTSEGIRIHLRPHGPARWFPVGFLLFWLAGWSGGGDIALRWLGSGSRFDLFSLVWLGFWLLGIVAVVATLARLVAGSDTLLVTERGLEVRSRPFSRPRRLQRHTLRRVAADGGSVSVETTAGKVQVTDLGTEADRLWLQCLLARRLGLGTDGDEARAEPVVFSSAPPEPPGWVVRREPAHVVLARPAGTRWAAAMGLLALNLFWNGIVGVFVAGGLGLAPKESIEGPAPVGSLFYWLFLTPFIAVGLCMAAGLLGALFVTEERWVARHHYEVRSRALGRTWSRTLGPGAFAVDRTTDSEGDSRFTLVLAAGTERNPVESGSEEHLLALGRFLSYHTGWPFLGVVPR